jgi:hypothetical protein
MADYRDTRTYEGDQRAYVDPDGRPVAARPSRIRRDAAYSEEADAGPGSTAAASAALTLARVVRLAVGILAGIIVAGILLTVLNANQSNDIVSTVRDAARALVGPFDGMFTLDDADATIAVNWGIAAVVYLIVGAIVAHLIALVGTAGVRRRTVPA